MVLLCRLVVRGYDQVIEDTGDTFASTPSLTTLKLLLTLSIAFGWRISTLDISATFLACTYYLEKTFFIPPLDFYPHGGVLWKLRRALYGLRNAPRLWQDHFKRMKSDPNLNVHNSKKQFKETLCSLLCR